MLQCLWKNEDNKREHFEKDSSLVGSKQSYINDGDFQQSSSPIVDLIFFLCESLYMALRGWTPRLHYISIGGPTFKLSLTGNLF